MQKWGLNIGRSHQLHLSGRSHDMNLDSQDSGRINDRRLAVLAQPRSQYSVYKRLLMPCEKMCCDLLASNCLHDSTINHLSIEAPPMQNDLRTQNGKGLELTNFPQRILEVRGQTFQDS